MYRIAICDDEPIFAGALAEMVQTVMEKEQVRYLLKVYNNGEELQGDIEAGESFDMLLLDILMGQMNGIDLAARLREQGQTMPVIFTTSSRDYALDGYRVQAMDYLLTPGNEEALHASLMKHYTSICQDYLILPSEGEQVKVAVNDIMYVENVNRKTVFYAENKEYSVPGPLSKTEKELPFPPFFRCHQGFLVNLNNIYKLGRYTAVMKDGSNVPVSRSFAKDMQEAFFAFVLRKI